MGVFARVLTELATERAGTRHVTNNHRLVRIALEREAAPNGNCDRALACHLTRAGLEAGAGGRFVDWGAAGRVL